MESHSKGEFLVLVKELKLFDDKFFFKHVATQHYFSQQCFGVVLVLFNNFLHSAILLADNTNK